MLYKLGTLTIKVQPFNVDRVITSGDTDFVWKPIVGAESPPEYVGEGANTFTLSGTLFPKVLGGLDELALLQRMRAQGETQWLQRGDGKPMGWVVILNVTTSETDLAGDGVGQKTAVSMKLRRAKAPNADALFRITSGLL